MKTVLLSLLLAMLGACQKEELIEAEAQATPYPQTWQLVKFSGQIPGIKTGADLPYQETYVFQADSTFTKTRQQKGSRVEARGTFSVRPYSGGQYTILTYNGANDLIGSCIARALKEHLVFKATDTLVNTWPACDGPRLEYKKLLP